MSAPRHFLDLWALDAADPARHPRRRPAPQGRAHAAGPRRGRRRRAGRRPHPGDDLPEATPPAPGSPSTPPCASSAAPSIIATGADMQLGRGETIEDTARVLSRMVDAVMIRADSHDDVERFAAAAAVPVINGLTDRSHPCQILADLMTFEEHRGPIAGKTIAWVGDGNNVCASFIHAAARFGFTPRRSPARPATSPHADDLARAERRGPDRGDRRYPRRRRRRRLRGLRHLGLHGRHRPRRRASRPSRPIRSTRR